MNSIQWLKTLFRHNFNWLSKPLHLLLTDILTVSQVAVSHIKLFHSTSTGVTRMQLAKVVVIANALFFAACSEGLPGGKDCVLKCFSDMIFPQMLSAILIK